MNDSQELNYQKYEQKMTDLQKQLDDVQSKVEALQKVFMYNFADWESEVRITVASISKKQIGNCSGVKGIYEQLYDQLEMRAGVHLDIRLHNRRVHMLESGIKQSAVNATTKLDIIKSDKKLKEIFMAILREMSAKYI